MAPLMKIQTPARGSLCIRDIMGELIYATTIVMINTTSLRAEAKAIEKELEYCVSHQYLQIFMSTTRVITKYRWSN